MIVAFVWVVLTAVMAVWGWSRAIGFWREGDRTRTAIYFADGAVMAFCMMFWLFQFVEAASR